MFFHPSWTSVTKKLIKPKSWGRFNNIEVNSISTLQVLVLKHKYENTIQLSGTYDMNTGLVRTITDFKVLFFSSKIKM